MPTCPFTGVHKHIDMGAHCNLHCVVVVMVVCLCVGGGRGQCYSTLSLSAPPRDDPWEVVHSVQLAKADVS